MTSSTHESSSASTISGGPGPEASRPMGAQGGPTRGPPTKCHFKESPAAQIACRFRHAVVGIHSEILLTKAGAAEGPAPPLEKSYFLEGNGFFIRGHYIVCPAHLVLIPPSLLKDYNRYPFVSSTQAKPSGERYPNAVTRVSRIIVDVQNVNYSGHSFAYEAHLIGVDGAGDIAVLRIDHNSGFNAHNPPLEKQHPFFHWGRSRACQPGMEIYALGDPKGYEGHQITSRIVLSGSVSENRSMDHQGGILPELLTVNLTIPLAAHASGWPLLNDAGRLVAMQTLNASVGVVGGPTEFFMRKVLKNLLCQPQGSTRKRDHVEVIQDGIKNFYRYVKGYCGVGYQVVNGSHYDTMIDANGHRQPRLGPQGEFLQSPACKEIVGVQIKGVAGPKVEEKNSNLVLPGEQAPAPYPADLPNSPFAASLVAGDIVTHLDDDCPLGDFGLQIPPALLMWRTFAGDRVKITYRKAVDNHEVCYSTTEAVERFPAFWDYPWYKLSSLPFEGAELPAGSMVAL